MLTISDQIQVGTLIARHPQLARILETHQIDYCCRGRGTLRTACHDQGLDVQTVIAELKAALDEPRPIPLVDWNSARLSELVEHIEQTHHEYMKTELPRLSQLIEKVSQVHGPKDYRLSEVQHVFAAMRNELESHMIKEEQILFPAIAEMELTRNGNPVRFAFGSVRNPVRMMEHEHDDAGKALRRLRQLTDDFTPPTNACPTYLTMLNALARLETDLHAHIHKENNILFPRALQLESESARCGHGTVSTDVPRHMQNELI